MCVIVDSCLYIDLRTSALLAAIWVWLVYIPNVAVNIRQFVLLSEEGVDVFETYPTDKSKDITTFVLLRIASSGLNLVTSLLCVIGVARAIHLLVLPFVITIILSTIGEFILSLLCWMMYWDDFYRPLSSGWKTASIPFYLIITAVNTIFTIALISLHGTMLQGHAFPPTMNEKLDNTIPNGFGFEDSGPPPAMLPYQVTARELPAPPVMDDECRNIMNDTLGRSARFKSTELSINITDTIRYELGRSESPVLLNASTIHSINTSISRH